MGTLAVLTVTASPLVALLCTGALLVWGWGVRGAVLVGTLGVLWAWSPAPVQDLVMAYGGVHGLMAVILLGAGMACFPYVLYGMMTEAARVETIINRRGRPVLGLVFEVAACGAVALPILLLGVVLTLICPGARGRVGRVGPLGNTLEVFEHGVLKAIVLLVRNVVIVPALEGVPGHFEADFKALARSVGVREGLPYPGDATFRWKRLVKAEAHQAAFHLGRQLMRTQWAP